MGRLLDVLAISVLSFGIAALVGGVYWMSNREDVTALFSLLAGTVLLRSSVDLLRPRSVG